jgi:hypothetical protein
MKTLVLCLVALAVSTPALAQSSHYVRGYVRRDGTYVAGHYQTNPDSSRLNNWSSQGNVNPYTGKVGTVDRYAPTSTYPSYPTAPSAPAAPQAPRAPSPPCYYNCPH